MNLPTILVTCLKQVFISILTTEKFFEGTNSVLRLRRKTRHPWVFTATPKSQCDIRTLTYTHIGFVTKGLTYNTGKTPNTLVKSPILVQKSLFVKIFRTYVEYVIPIHDYGL